VAEGLPAHEVDSGNVFADTDRPDPEIHLLKARLVSRIQDVIDERKLSQVRAAALLGIAQPDLSNILRGRFRGYSVDRIMRLLMALGCEVDIVVRSPGELAHGNDLPAAGDAIRPMRTNPDHLLPLSKVSRIMAKQRLTE
jgi:predicted XRE-type DNA-binding protein